MADAAPVDPPAPVGEKISLVEDGGILKEIKEVGDGSSPQAGDEIVAHYTGTLEDGSKFDSSRDRNAPFKFIIGQGQVIKGWDIGFASMSKGEKAVLTIKAEYGYGASGHPPSIPGGATLIFDVELISFGPKKKEKWELSATEKIDAATTNKAEGNTKFKAKDFAGAMVDYEEALDYIKFFENGTDEETATVAALSTSLNLNIAQAALKLNDMTKAIASTTEVLNVDAENTKALFRRGSAFIMNGQLSEAKVDLMAAYKKDPKNAAVRKELGVLKEKIAAAKKKTKATFGGMFSDKKVSLYDEKSDVKESLVIPNDAHKDCPKVFMDIKVGEDEPARVEFELFADTVPNTAENFRALCTGEKGECKTAEGKNLHYKDSIFHRVIPNFMCQGGDFTNANGTGGESIYGDKFDDEAFVSEHSDKYLLSMANAGPNTNGSQFFITTALTPHLDGKHVVFGRVIKGFEVVDKMNSVETGVNDKPNADVVIVDCGEIKDE